MVTAVDGVKMLGPPEYEYTIDLGKIEIADLTLFHSNISALETHSKLIFFEFF